MAAVHSPVGPQELTAIARLEIWERGRRTDWGTAFLINTRYALTALHVVADRKSAGTPLKGDRLRLVFLEATDPNSGGEASHPIERDASVVMTHVDEHLDWALLELATGVPDIEPLLLRESPVDTMTPFQSFGYASTNPRDGLMFSGHIENPNGRCDGSPALQLYSVQAAAPDTRLSGQSGAPVFSSGAVIGIVRAFIEREDSAVAGTVYACRIDAPLVDAFVKDLSRTDPCAGIPALSDDLPVPAEPFRYLERYRRSQARLFFGRCRELAEVASALVGERRILLIYGQSGVGKSSFLEAGLAPRLERRFDIRIRRRSRALGLARDLAQLLEITEDSSDVDAFEAAWRALEANSPDGGASDARLLILDQVEEAWTQPPESEAGNHAQATAAEIDALFSHLHAHYAGAASLPSTRIILSFRKEWLPEIDDALCRWSLPSAGIHLTALDSDAIEEIIQSIPRTPRLASAYKLQVTAELSDRVASDLARDERSAIAPTLQVLLTNLWHEARIRDRERPTFDIGLYTTLRDRGLGLDRFLDERLAALSPQYQGDVASGLALDVLHFHTTDQVTSGYSAAERSEIDIVAQYGPTVAPRLLQLCAALTDAYLLVDAPAPNGATQRAWRLVHDTLATIVRERFSNSQLPGQRARRILEIRASQWVEGRKQGLLDDRDLTVVETGAPGMGAWTTDETSLVTASRQHQRRRQRQQRWRYAIMFMLLMGIVASAALAWRQASVAERERNAAALQRNLATARFLLAEGAKLELRNSGAVRERALLALHAYRLNPTGEATQALAQTLTELNHFTSRFRIADEAIAISNNGAYIAAFSTKSRRLQVYSLSLLHKAPLWTSTIPLDAGSTPQAIAVSPDGRQAAMFLVSSAQNNALILVQVAETAGKRSPTETLRLTSRPAAPIGFRDLHFSTNGEYLWGAQEHFGMNTPPPSVVLIHTRNSKVITIALSHDATSLAHVSVSPSGRFVTILTRHGIGGVGPSLITIRELPSLKVVAEFQSPVSSSYAVAVAPDDKTLVVTGESVAYAIVEDWTSTKRSSRTIQRAAIGMRLTIPKPAGFIPALDALVLSNEGGLTTAPVVGRPSPYATVIRNWRETPEASGEISNQAEDIESWVNSGDITSIGIGDRRVVTTDLGGRVAVWEPFFRYGTPRIKLPHQITSLGVPRQGNEIFVTDVVFDRVTHYPTTGHVIAIDNWNTFAPQLRSITEAPEVGANAGVISDNARLIASVVAVHRPEGGIAPGVRLTRPTGEIVKSLRYESPQYVSYVREQDRQWEEDRVAKGEWRLVDLTISHDGNAVATLDDDGRVTIWLNSATKPYARVGMAHSATAIAFAEDGNHLLISSGSHLETWRLNAARTPLKVSEVNSEATDATIVAFATSSQDKYLAIGSDAGTVTVFRDWKGGKASVVRTLMTERDPSFNKPARVMSLAFHPRADVLAVLDRREVQVVDLERLETWVRFSRYSFQSNAAVRFSSDGEYLVSTTSDDYVFWPWKPEELIDDACTAFLFRDFTDSEWRRLVPFAERRDPCAQGRPNVVAADQLPKAP